ncbi:MULTISPECIES: methionyl-tRNA formyltransferase [Micrococcaceae]|uniref:methionyl-tRNA formyltransferase n=1 Tax=Micrococcaceae TaxID=1268 RepID=UPI003460786D
MTPTPIKVVLFSEINSKLGAPFLEVLAEHPLVDLVAVVTSPPGKVSPYFTKDKEQVDLAHMAGSREIPVHRPRRVNDPELHKTLTGLRPDYFIVGNFQQLLKEPLLAIPRVLPVNFHPSPLPEYAGIAPFYWMIRRGARYSAVTALEMDTGLDTGRIIMQKKLPMSGRETALELRTVQEQANVVMLTELIPQLADETFTLTPQNLSARSYFSWPTDEDYALDFTSSAAEVERAVRAGYRNPGAHAPTPGGERLIVLSVDFAGGAWMPPLEAPGTWARTRNGVYVACADAWLEVLSVDHDGTEVPTAEHPLAARLGQTAGALAPMG